MARAPWCRRMPRCRAPPPVRARRLRLRMARTGRRWSATLPASVGLLSTTYSLFIVGEPFSGPCPSPPCAGPATLRREANSRISRTLSAPSETKSASSDTITSALPRCTCSATGSPNAASAPAAALSLAAGSHVCQRASGSAASSASICALKSRRGDVSGKDAQAGAALAALRLDGSANDARGFGPGARLAEVSNGLRTIRIVEAEDRRLGVDVGGAEALRDARGCPRSWWAAPCGFRRAPRARSRGARRRWRRRAAGRARSPRAP